VNSGEINEKIRQIEAGATKLYEWGDTGKSFPYIGWFWREINFDGDFYPMGVLPILDHPMKLERNDQPRVGFMANNKWGYEEFNPTKEQRDEIRRLIVEACVKPSEESLRAVDAYIQSLLPEKYRSP